MICRCAPCRLARKYPGRYPAGGCSGGPPPGPCAHEGPVVDPAACGCADKDVRWCLLPAADWDHCTRGRAREPVRSCPTCPFHTGSAAGKGT